jgi:CDP-4-dehydro-6-deoxyglucose reductase
MADIPDMSGWQVYACGSPLMVDAARRDFIARCKLPEGQFYADSFLSQADSPDFATVT